MSLTVRSLLVGVALAVVVLLLGDLADALRGATGGASNIRWAVAVQVALGGVALYGATYGRDDWIVPAVAAALLAWPLLAALLPWWPGLPEWVPLLSNTTTNAVIVGVLATGAMAGRRLG